MTDPSLQQKLCDVTACIWVNASAGTGKTKALTDRVLALLLNNIKPESILCLTFTNMAASEMGHRIRVRLLEWAQIEASDLSENLSALLGQKPTAHQMTLASQLFYRLVDRMHMLKITTIHGYCLQLLSQFPLEAGIAPHLKVMDDIENIQLFEKSLETVFTSSDPKVHISLEQIAPYVSEGRLPSLIRSYLDAVMLRTHTNKQGLKDNEWTKQIDAELQSFMMPHSDQWSPFDRDQLKTISQALEKSPESMDQKKSVEIFDLFKNHGDSLSWSQLTPIFLTNKGTLREKLCSKRFSLNYPHETQTLQCFAQRALNYSMHAAMYKMAISTHALAQLTHALVQKMELLKGERLDFTDLIHSANGLLAHPQMAPWINYKLSESLDHILVDEAQDTSPLQWHFITQLAQDFFDTESSHKTLFVVGDMKQSIYSFQGAFLESFLHFQNLFKNQAQLCGKQWWDIALRSSYRTTGPLLNKIDAVFNTTQARRALGIAHEPLSHPSARLQSHGLLTLFPKFGKEQGGTHPVEATAQAIAQQIYSQIHSNYTIVGKNRSVRPQDYLILVQQRGPLTQALYNALLEHGLPTAPADRTRLNEHLITQDILAFAKWSLNTQDDFSLACVLCSPFGKLDPTTRQALVLNRGTVSLWEHIMHQELYYELTQTLQRWQQEACSRATSDFFIRLFAYFQKDFLTDYGPSIIPLLDAFLGRVTQYEAFGQGLQGFVEWFEIIGDYPIKRVLGHEQTDQIRIMTVHSAKGLQSPIVILADATRLPDVDFEFIQNPQGKGLLWIANASLRTAALSQAHEDYINRLYDEYYRLLYVALTRAEDELMVFGWEDRATNHPLMSWYDCLSCSP